MVQPEKPPARICTPRIPVFLRHGQVLSLGPGNRGLIVIKRSDQRKFFEKLGLFTINLEMLPHFRDLNDRTLPDHLHDEEHEDISECTMVKRGQESYKRAVETPIFDRDPKCKFWIKGRITHQQCDINEEIFEGIQYYQCDEHGIEICDTRDVPRNCNLSIRRSYSAFEKEPALRDSSLIVNKMKLLSDQVTLIATDIEGEMRMVDLRMRRPVLTYSGHVGFKYPRPLCLDESLDLLCATGKDNYVRIWSLSSGHLLWADRIYGQTLPSENSLETIIHCCIIPSPRRWFIAVIENQKVIPIVPAPGYLPKNN
ncbi:DDB1-and CUL4-associated factor 4-like protein 1 [Trichonephila clavipes]|nr:DDB1-and CUL4-associated factor 4-like protein 1 [Trichonephila clavipes]